MILIRDAVKRAKEILSRNERLRKKGLVDPEAEQIVISAYQKVSGVLLSRFDLFSKSTEGFPDSASSRLEEMAQSRVDGQLLQHITGTQGFLDHVYEVGPEVLVPRPETELLASTAISELRKREDLRSEGALGIEVGIGSGVISIELLSEMKNLRMAASDVVPDALELAERNASRILGAPPEASRLDLRRSPAPSEVLSVFEDLRGDVDFLISNPPYLVRSDSIEDEVLRNEPSSALFAPEGDPLFYYRAIAEKGPRLLRPGGQVFLEIPSERANSIGECFHDQGWNLDIRLDLGKQDRILVAKLARN